MMIEKLNRTVFATLAPSKVHGIGVFAIRDIPKGTRYTDHTNDTLDNIVTYQPSIEEFQYILPEVRALILDRTIFNGTELKFTSPNTDAVLRSFMNHSVEANTDGERTLRDVRAGEELTENYFLLTDNVSFLTEEHMKDIF